MKRSHLNFTFSGMERYVRIVETVRRSDARLSGVDRMQIINDLLDGPDNPAVHEIELKCTEVADQNLGDRLVAAHVMRDYERGY